MRDRWFGPAVLGGLAAAALTAVACAGDWARASGDNAGVAVTARADGADVAPLAVALALVALAAWGVLLVVRSGRVRRAVAVLGAVAAAGVVTAVVAAFDRAQVDAVEATQAAGATSDTFASSLTPWYWVSAVASALSLLTLAVAVARVPRWPAMGTRYDSPAAREAAPDADDDLWKALDEGRDPTA